MPNAAHYTQCVDYIRQYSSFLAKAKKDALLGGKPVGLLRIKTAWQRQHAR